MLIRLLVLFTLISELSGIHSNSWGMEGQGLKLQHPQVVFSPARPKTKLYKGFDLEEPIKDVSVKPCISLGGSCTDKIAEYIVAADEFIVVFMYRLDSPSIINALANKTPSNDSSNKFPAIAFLDYEQSIGDSSYNNYVKHLIDNVPTSLVKLGSKSFHHKITITKKKGFQAIVSVGSANSTYESDNIHSEDTLFIQSNSLAEVLLRQFHSLLTMKTRSKEQNIKIYHLNRLKTKESNTNQVLSFLSLLLETDSLSGEEGYMISDIISLSLSTGFGSRSDNACLTSVKRLLKEKSSFLIFFENYLNDLEIIQLVNDSDVPKLIVLDDNKDNRNPPAKIEENNLIFFEPYTQGKFHHKLIIQYFDEDDPIVYMGSLNLSRGGLNNSSEILIGVKSPVLPQEYLSAILFQSDLGYKSKVWQFFADYPQLTSTGSKLHKTGSKILIRALQRISNYPDKFEWIISSLPLQEDTSRENPRESSIERFKKERSNYERGNLLEKHAIMHDWYYQIRDTIYSQRDFLFESPMREISSALGIESWKFRFDIKSSEDHNLQSLGEWIKNAKAVLKNKTDKVAKSLKELKSSNEGDEDKEVVDQAEILINTLPDLKKIKVKLQTIDSIYLFLYYSSGYLDEFGPLATLHDILHKILHSE